MGSTRSARTQPRSRALTDRKEHSHVQVSVQLLHLARRPRAHRCIWAIVGGCFTIFAGFGSGETAGTRAIFILTGLVWVAFGVVLCAKPNVGVVTLALLFGLFNLIAGVTMVTQGVEIRRTGKSLHSVMPSAPKAA
jgi:Short repeat of unknown function (DUF308)